MLLRGSLLANVRAFATEPTAEGEAEAARAAEGEAGRRLDALGVRARLAALPRGLHTAVEEAALSEGERQLLCVCRALCAQGGAGGLRALLADEPTSHVDYGSDGRVMDALLGEGQGAQRGASVLVNCHRLQHLRRFDRVVVLERGAVVEEGAAEELLADASSRLSAMWRANQGGE